MFLAQRPPVVLAQEAEPTIALIASFLCECFIEKACGQVKRSFLASVNVCIFRKTAGLKKSKGDPSASQSLLSALQISSHCTGSVQCEATCADWPAGTTARFMWLLAMLIHICSMVVARCEVFEDRYRQQSFEIRICLSIF
ncbi:hypothetical protein CHARACLAT_005333 [Characodon lateralis]|uniref:Uncharacterized protein n=1 Tax=Characodon lateralis TaxID=208331 RepID=A0ABU7E794_9TELE|nr:hypothetical protein [Characodon lateralis]